MSADTEERLRLDTEHKLAEEHEHRLFVEVETREVQAALAAEEGRTRAEETRVAMPGEEICRLSLVKNALKKEKDALVSVIYDDVGGQVPTQQEDQPGMHLRKRIGFEKQKLKQMEREVGNTKRGGVGSKCPSET